ncbi:prolyl oligopeptidase family serine peptidase [Sulfitobacter sp. D35]|uniref:alpha/beta hydrolase family esterase n=1 Tax=Sulfitobacter sp. D35 TaxID=3083252 RepID=UPI00296EADC7|nr:prolyl oligopeptidase family serine peptidase [Sulfitobacter sp. D35]MDW4498407.1 prolyl oligopeptidase family serine peptidase [Sulfitobacter sp. D35]
MRWLAALTISIFAAPALACGPDSDCVIDNRTYRIAMPENHDGATPVGAVVFAHGYRGSAAGVMRNGSLRRAVSNMGLALIAADAGENDWNIPNAPRNMDSDGSVEFTYFAEMLDDAAERFPIDADRVMMTGFSAGGMMTWNLACNLSDRFAAFAPISGTFWLGPPESCEAPVASILHIHGDDDSTVPLDGRPILETRQGKVSDALEMYADFGGFDAVDEAESGGLRCTMKRNPEGEILDFCLFAGGHSFRTEFVAFAWETFEKAGKL